ncbi:LLM class flavin-dependent oxidoreductase [Gloeothece verrucosa]|uniref:Alkanesulfonate monooxygenase n=1 Tax=Gloeothece verrucosa (strain PCC 7822) TaxID=497965 RepID=E0UKZ1_GLOV7|nr:LLM class flavin-dependent oxidoreductase [Gloeothece verrucosa]ADN17621.1 Alkanesulfonate monooxygenase [Gloeothece verrucosa PCC 7822]
MILRFHWMLPLGGERAGESNILIGTPEMQSLPDLETKLEFCRRADEMGIDSLLTAFGYYRPDPIVLATALGMVTQKTKFIIAYRPGLISPTLFVQQINTLASLTNGRVSLNIIAGYSQEEQGYYGDFLSHDQRYDRASEFVGICQELWRNQDGVNFQGQYYQVKGAKVVTPFISEHSSSPEIYIGGGSLQAQELAMRHRVCWLRFIDAPEKIETEIQPILTGGGEVCLRTAIIARPTRKEALEAAYSLINPSYESNKEWVEKLYNQSVDSQSIKTTLEQAKAVDSDWITPWLWRGAVPYFGASAVALVGTPVEIASALLHYKQIGCSQFIFSGWPKIDAMTYFGQEILPLVREMEKKVAEQQ